MDLYQKYLAEAGNDEEKLEILSGLGISSLRREKDLGNYIRLLDRKQNEDIMLQTDFEMMEGLTPREVSYANTLTTRRDLINYILSIRNKNKEKEGKKKQNPQNQGKQKEQKQTPHSENAFRTPKRKG